MVRKIAVTTGTRSEYGILRPILENISKNKKLELYLIVTGMHNSKKFGLTIKEIKKDGFKIFKKFDMLPINDSNYSVTVALSKGIKSFADIFKNLNPDINLILGDRDEMLASAIAAYHMNIPNAHIHGGDRSQGGIDEYTRHAITKISNIHFTASKKSKQRVIKMGENPKYTIFTGSPAIDEILSERITNKNDFEKKYGFQPSKNYIILLQHSVTTEINQSRKQIRETLSAIERLHCNTIALAPNSDAGHEAIFQELRTQKRKSNFNLYESIPREDFLCLLKNCGVLVGNSSSGMIEASYFNIPVVNIGIRQKGRERSKNVIDVNHSSTEIFNAVLKCLHKKTNITFNEMIYGNGNASKKIVKFIEEVRLSDELLKKQIMY